MKVKTSMSYLVKLFGVEKEEIRIIFSELLGSDVLNSLAARYQNLGQLSKATDEDILSVPGIGEKTLKQIKETLGVYFNDLSKKDELTGMPEDLTSHERKAYAELMFDADIVSSNCKKVKKALENLPSLERKFIKLYYGLNKYNAPFRYRQISVKLNVPMCELDDLSVKALGHLRELACADDKKKKHK